MHTGKSLYEPQLVELWKARYRKFESEEMARRFRQKKENLKANNEARTTNDVHAT